MRGRRRREAAKSGIFKFVNVQLDSRVRVPQERDELGAYPGGIRDDGLDLMAGAVGQHCQGAAGGAQDRFVPAAYEPRQGEQGGPDLRKVGTGRAAAERVQGPRTAPNLAER